MLSPCGDPPWAVLPAHALTAEVISLPPGFFIIWHEIQGMGAAGKQARYGFLLGESSQLSGVPGWDG